MTKTMKMNRIILATIAAGTAVMMLLASCQRDELTGGTPAGEEVTVSISAVMPEGGEPVVRSATDPGDGSDVNRCIMSIYLADEGLADGPILYAEKVIAQVSGKTAVFPDQRLVSGHDYRFVFWADHVEDNTSETGRATDLNYDTQTFPTISFKDEVAYKSNDDPRDAFFLSEVVTVSGPSTQSFELRRPFGQLNIITNDWGAIPEEAAAQLRPAKVKLTFNDVPNTIDLLTGEVSGAADLTGEAVEVSEIAQDGDAKHLSFDYILAEPNDQTILSDFTMDFLADDGNTKVTDTYTFTNIPVQRNYQTNVRGNLLTDRIGVEIEVVPEFDGEYNEIVPEKEVDSEQALLEVLKEGGYAKLKNDITITGGSSVADGKEVALDLNNCTLTLTGTMSTKGVSSLTLINGTVKSPETYGAANFLVSASAGGSVALENVIMESVGAGIGIEPNGDPGKVTVRNSEITAYSFAVGTNASSPIYNAEIELINSQLVGMSAVLMNLPSKITVSKCVLQGSMQAMILRAGTAEITDSQLKLVYDSSNGEGGTPEDAKDHYIDGWLTGNAVPLAALTVGNDNSDGYLFKTELSLENVDIISEESAPLPAMYVRANEDADKGVTITYGAECRVNGEIVYYDGGKNITISGTPVIVDADDDTRP